MIDNQVIDILVVEDEMNADLLTQRIKNEFKANVRVHKNGRGFLSNQEEYLGLDLIVVDQQYTKDNLISTLSTIRKKSPGTEVVVLSSEKDAKVIHTIKDAGAYDFIYKDRAALDKIIYVIRSFWSKKELVKDNIRLKLSRQKSKSALAIMVVLIIGILALFIYLLTR